MTDATVPLILASASPRRKEILEAHGHSPIVIPSHVDETLPPGADFTPEKTTVYLAELKAHSVLAALDYKDWLHGCLILGVDTIVYKDSIIGKPIDEADAIRILRSLKNSRHEVISGVCLIHAKPQTPHPSTKLPASGQKALKLDILESHSFYDTTTVRFGDYADEEILAYIRANPPYDKSGSYAVQSDWGRHVLELNGDIENVIGLPYQKLSDYL